MRILTARKKAEKTGSNGKQKREVVQESEQKEEQQREE